MRNMLTENWGFLEKELEITSFIESFLKNPSAFELEEALNKKALDNLYNFISKNKAVVSDVNSSVLKTIEYQPKKKKLIITFVNGREYEYYDVPQDIIFKLFRARSHGKSFRRFVRGNPEKGSVPFDYDEV